MNDAVAVPAFSAESPAPEADLNLDTPLPAGRPPVAGKAGKKKRRPQGQQQRVPAMKLDPATKPPRQRPADQGRRNDNGVSRREQARETMLNFMPIASHPAEPCTATIQTEYTRRLFHDHYGRAQISLYNLMQFLPIKIRQSRSVSVNSDQFLDALEDLIDARLAELASRLNKELAQARKVATDNGVNAVSTYSRPPQQVQLALLTPQIGDLIGLLPVFDQYIAYMDALYLNRYVKRSQREAHINAFRNEIVKLIRYLMHLYHESKRLIEKGEASDFMALLKAPVDPDSLRDRLDDEDEAAARTLTGAPAEAEAEVAAA